MSGRSVPDGADCPRSRAATAPRSFAVTCFVNGVRENPRNLLCASSELPSFTLAVKSAFASLPRVTISENACRTHPALLVFSQ